MQKNIELKNMDQFETSIFVTVTAEIGKEITAEIFKEEGINPKNENSELDDSYVVGELQFNFDIKTKELCEILLFPSYENGDGDIVNGDFINVFDLFADREKEARKML